MSSPAPDVSQLASEKLPEAAFPAGGRTGYRFYLDPAVHAGVWQHARDNIAVEICGVLVGTVARDADGPFAHVRAFIRGEAAANKLAEVTFTHDTWARINQEMDTKYADQRIIGWYHSHPDFGVFLSDRDRFIQEHFFGGPGQVAYVVDPVRGTEGVFTWQAGKPALAPHYWVGDRVQVGTAAGDEPQPATQPTSTPAAPPPPAGPPAWLASLSAAGWYLLVFLLGFLLAHSLAQGLTNFERARMQADATARALVYYQYRPGLGEQLDETHVDLAKSAKELNDLSKDHLKRLEDSPETKEKWQKAIQSLVAADEKILQMRARYTPTPEETARMLQILGSLKPPGKPDDKAKPTEDKPKDKAAEPAKPAPADKAKGP
jgi:proteasome lid subunit RPN8/RPN11